MTCPKICTSRLRLGRKLTRGHVLGQKLGNLQMLAFSINLLQFLGSPKLPRICNVSTLQFLSNSGLARDFREGTQFGIN
jgi:hypothetical protein